MENLSNLNSPKDSIQFLNSIEPRLLDKTVLNDEWLEDQPKDRLIRALKVLATRVQSDPTQNIKTSDFDLKIDQGVANSEDPVAAIEEFIVPRSMQGVSKTPDHLRELHDWSEAQRKFGRT